MIINDTIEHVTQRNIYFLKSLILNKLFGNHNKLMVLPLAVL